MSKGKLRKSFSTTSCQEKVFLAQPLGFVVCTIHITSRKSFHPMTVVHVHAIYKGTGSRTIALPGLQINLWPPVISTFDLLTSNAHRFMPLSCASLHSFSKHRVHKFGNRQTNGRTDGRTNARKNKPTKKITPLTVHLAWRRHKNPTCLLVHCCTCTDEHSNFARSCGNGFVIRARSPVGFVAQWSVSDRRTFAVLRSTCG